MASNVIITIIYYYYYFLLLLVHKAQTDVTLIALWGNPGGE